MSKIKSIKRVGNENVYNMTVDDVHNFLIQGDVVSHNCDGIRYLCVYWVSAPERENREKTHKWTPDMWEDYENASPDDQKYLIGKWGRPE